MVGRVIRKLLNRRKGTYRVTLAVRVQATDPEGIDHDVESEDVSSTGVRLKFEKVGLATVLGHREEIPLKIWTSDEDSVSALGQLVWAYNTAQGGSVSGWRFVDLAGGDRRELVDFIKSNSI